MIINLHFDMFNNQIYYVTQWSEEIVMTDFGDKALNMLCRRRSAYSRRKNFQRIKASRKDNTLGNKVKLVLLLFLFLTGRQAAYANVPNTYWATPGENDFTVELNNTGFPSNQAGTTLEIPYRAQGDPTRYRLNFNNQTGQSSTETHMLVDSVLPASDINPGYLKLNDFIDVRVLIIKSGAIGSWSYFGNTPNLIDGIGWANIFNYGLYGTLGLRLRKDIIGGAIIIPRDEVVASVFRSMRRIGGRDGIPRNPLPSFRIVLKGQTLPTPVECSIQADKRDVDFKDLSSADITIDGSRYGQELQLTYRCNTPRNLPVKVNMIADNSSFSSNFIATSNPNLGIVMEHGGKTVKPWGSFDSTLMNGTGSDRIYVAPVKNPTAKTIATGDFTANAVLVLSLQ